MIRKWLYNLNKKYDSVKEPNRIFLLMAIASPGIISTSFEDINIIYFGGMVYLLTILAIRALYIHGKLK